MKKTKFRVYFSNSNYEGEFITVHAFNQGQALILAQAKRINEGLDYTLDRIEVIPNR